MKSLFRSVVAAGSLLPVALPAQDPLNVSPTEFLNRAYDPLTLVREDPANWSAAEKAALSVVQENAHSACDRYTKAGENGQALLAVSQLCAIGMHWQGAYSASSRYLRDSTDADGRRSATLILLSSEIHLQMLPALASSLNVIVLPSPQTEELLQMFRPIALLCFSSKLGFAESVYDAEESVLQKWRSNADESSTSSVASVLEDVQTLHEMFRKVRHSEKTKEAGETLSKQGAAIIKALPLFTNSRQLCRRTSCVLVIETATQTGSIKTTEKLLRMRNPNVQLLPAREWQPRLFKNPDREERLDTIRGKGRLAIAIIDRNFGIDALIEASPSEILQDIEWLMLGLNTPKR